MRLNEKGFELSTMLAFCLCFCLCLIFVAVSYNQKLSTNTPIKNNNTVSKSDNDTNKIQTTTKDSSKYQEIEQALAKEIEDSIGDKVSYGKLIISNDNIKSNFESLWKEYTELKDCTGYAIIDADKKETKVYLNCYKNYQTQNYNIDFE